MTSARRSSRESARRDSALARYWVTTRRPLQILVFLLPLVLLYELALVSVLRSESVNIDAHRRLREFFESLGLYPAGLYLPGVLLVVVLLIWHLLAREKWTIDWKALGGMAIESMVLVLPLFVFSQVIARLAVGAWMVEDPSDISRYSLLTRLSISIGAGLYEELIFRMLIIALVHAILVDVAQQKESVGATVGVMLSAILFTIYHPNLTGPRMLFFFIAGIYFGLIYLWRGFGIVVATHALYDIATVMTLPDSSG